jgi:hypothetical protein
MITITRDISKSVNKKKKIFNLDNSGFEKIPVVSNNVLRYL